MERDIEPGHGRIDAGLFARGTESGGVAGGYVDASARFSDSLSAFARGEVGGRWGSQDQIWWQAIMGVRGTW